jgi:lysophospholipase L1-like esterase
MKIPSLLLALALISPLCATAGDRWISTWVSSQYLVDQANQPPPPGLAGRTLRQVIQPSLDGTVLRLQFSNQYGDGPLVIGAATIARSEGAATINVDTVGALTFSGQPGVTVAAGGTVMSDPLPFPVRAFENLAVSVHVLAVPPKLTGHPGSRTTSFISPGDTTRAAGMHDAATADRWYLLAAVDVQPVNPAAVGLVVLGDSITDGRGSTTNANDRWPNLLARRLHAAGRTDISVLNHGIGGNRILRFGNGPAIVDRFERDVLGATGARGVIFFAGVNDIGTAVGPRAKGEKVATPRDVIAAFKKMIKQARAQGLLVYGATITPFEGFTSYYTPESEADRQELNEWIRHSGKFDGVIDFDAIARDPAKPTHLSAAVDGGDHLHPSAAGYRIMADGIDLKLFDSLRPAK